MLQNNSLCVVDVVGINIYNFSNSQIKAEETLIKAIESNKEDIETWSNHCKNYPDTEQFKIYLKQAQDKKYEIMTYEEFVQLERKHFLDEPLKEIDEERFEDMLNVLPPIKWCTIDGIEMFCMSEMLTGFYTSQYMHDKGRNKYYHKIVDVTDKETWGHNFIN